MRTTGHGKEPVSEHTAEPRAAPQAGEGAPAPGGRRARPVKLADAQLELARQHGFASWPRLKEYVERLGAEQPFHTDIEYYEGRADGIATVNGVTRPRLAATSPQRHGFRPGAPAPARGGAARRRRAADAVHPRLPRRRGGRPRRSSPGCSTPIPSSCRQRGTNGNDLLGMANTLDVVRLMLDRGADPNRGNDYGWTKLHQAGLREPPELARDDARRRRAHRPLGARRRRHAPDRRPVLGPPRRRRRCSAASRATCAWPRGSACVDMIRELAGTPAAGAHRAFYRPHGGFPAWQPSDDRQEVLDEALVWAAKSGRVLAFAPLVGLGADVERRPLPRHAAHLGGGQRPRARDASAGRAGRRAGPARDVRWPDPRRGRPRDQHRRPGRADGRRARRSSTWAPTRRSGTPSTAGWPTAGREFGGHDDIAALVRERG